MRSFFTVISLNVIICLVHTHNTTASFNYQQRKKMHASKEWDGMESHEIRVESADFK
jgi:hypothetical protein